jgi:Ribbon-helix-helix domain
MHLCYYANKELDTVRTTVTINDKLFRALKMRAAETDVSISRFVEDAIKYQVLEDFEDIEDAENRQRESTHSFDDLVRQFKAEGLL